MNLGDVISRYRTQHQMSMDKFSEISGISKAYISMLEKNQTQRGDEPSPSIEMYRNVARAIGIDVDELIRMVDGKISMSPLPSNIIPMPEMRKIPLIGTIACGAPILADEHIDEYLDIPDHINADFALRCKGDSMINARIFSGDIVYIRQQDMVENGEIAAVLNDDGEATLKRVLFFEDHIILQPENPQHAAKTYWHEDMNAIHIIGKAVAFTSAIR